MSQNKFLNARLHPNTLATETTQKQVRDTLQNGTIEVNDPAVLNELEKASWYGNDEDYDAISERVTFIGV
jgi:hypothetical protein